ncbi:MAG TPA: NAD(P)/FAD-dependent oxidoreductase [Thermotogae bacterium]|nr:NAD(P)/FAD-dependent oxidoreductase [Thermotogota bacterium]
MRYLIIGTGPAGIAAAEKIRGLDEENEILMLTSEEIAGYSKPLITYFLGRKVNEDRMFYRPPWYFEERNISVMTSTKVIEVNPAKKLVITESGEAINYDRLLIATGGLPIVPEIEGLNPSEMEGVFTFTQWKDSKDVAKYITDNDVTEAVVLGGGLIGLKTTEALLELGLKVSIVELSDRILSNTFDKKASMIVTSALQKRGCNVYTNDTIVQVKGKKKITKVVLKSGREIKTKLLIIAIGVKPNVGFLKESGVRVNRGVVVNEHMETNITDIFAAGDCAEFYDPRLGKSSTIAIWPVAFSEGEVAGYNMAGERVSYQGGIPMNSVEIAGVATISVGNTSAEVENVEILEYESDKRSVYKKLVIKDGKLVGAVFVGDIDRAGIYTGLILQKVDVSSFKDDLMRDDFGLVYLPKEYRKKLMEGELKVWLE